MYEGWEIYAYGRKISKTEEVAIKNKLNICFNNEDWYCSINTHRIVIFYGPDKQEINVSFQETKYGSERDTDTYRIVFKSMPFGYKTSSERTHQELCKKTLQKIPWKKQGFWLEDGAQIPIPKFKRLQTRF